MSWLTGEGVLRSRCSTFSAYSAASTPQRFARRAGRGAERSASARSARMRTSASARPVGGRPDRRAARSSSSSTTSGMPARFPPTIARPRQAASSATRGRPSEREGRQTTQAASIAAATPSASSRFDHSICAGSADERARRARASSRRRRCASRAAGTRGRRARARLRRGCRTPCSARARRRTRRAASGER